MKQTVSQSHRFVRIALCIIIGAITLNISSVPQSSQKIVADIWSSGGVTVNGTAVTSGVAVFNNSEVKTNRQGSATVNVGKQGRIKMEPETEMVLEFANGLIGGNQMLGVTSISANRGTKSKVTTPHVVVESDGVEMGLIIIDVKPEYTCVLVNRGTARWRAGQKFSFLRQGQALSFDARGIQENGNCDGLGPYGFSLPLAVGAASATALVPLTRSAIGRAQGRPVVPVTADGVSNQSSPSPHSTSTNNPTTPVDPPAASEKCGCRYDGNGNPLSNSQRVTISHFTGNGNCQTLTVTCAALLGHFNLNNTPRNGHILDACGPCTQ